ncbi:thioredoxin domain-containing protein [Myxococcus sp. K15C18031901]|uniref:vitamin K epoxide reductase/DsbA family protein n=1 Tax=Myxococcus dinghuensis TaxID=2906761 RepID=UPI0020A7F37D|nr:thioredoxin domain-containing protein [Myxococcus dinghuensis]MCP3100130.1 thioredoxin domain-containing protein [Myxococcus dinghuensis]
MSPKSSKNAPAAAPAAPPATPTAVVALLVLGLVESALSAFQWKELLVLRGGGETVCGISETVNCETVWNSAFATRIHELFGLPVAGLGLVWGISVVALSALYLARARSGKPLTPVAHALRLSVFAGVLSVLVFASASLRAGAVCPTCLGTYALVAVMAVVAYRGLPGPRAPASGEWGPALTWAGVTTLAVFVAVLLPGRSLSTPEPKAGAWLPPASTQASSPDASTPQQSVAPLSLEAYLRGLPMQQQQQVSNALALYRRDTPRAAAAPARHRYGPVDAPVKIVEWTDSKCPHCKALVEELAVLKKRIPEGKMSLEARQFPLDGACNPAMQRRGPDAPTVRCVAARAQICLEGAQDFWTLREKLFAQQAVLDTERVMEIASSGSVPRAQLEACMASPATAAKLQEDSAYALRYNFTGTPLVVVNGRQAMPSAPFLYALVMADGNPGAPGFDVLPPPQAMAQDDHAGHNH